RVPAWLRAALVEPVARTLASHVDVSLLVKADKYIKRANIPYPDRLYSYGFFKEPPLPQLLEGDLLSQLGADYDPYAALKAHYAAAPARTELDRQLYIDLKMAISDNDVLKVTRMTEAAGIGVRYPFLDHRLAEFAARVPSEVKMRGRRLRAFFKTAYRDLLAPETLRKPKPGLGV